MKGLLQRLELRFRTVISGDVGLRAEDSGRRFGGLRL